MLHLFFKQITRPAVFMFTLAILLGFTMNSDNIHVNSSRSKVCEKLPIALISINGNKQIAISNFIQEDFNSWGTLQLNQLNKFSKESFIEGFIDCIVGEYSIGVNLPPSRYKVLDQTGKLVVRKAGKTKLQVTMDSYAKYTVTNGFRPYVFGGEMNADIDLLNVKVKGYWGFRDEKNILIQKEFIYCSADAEVVGTFETFEDYNGTKTNKQKWNNSIFSVVNDINGNWKISLSTDDSNEILDYIIYKK